MPMPSPDPALVLRAVDIYMRLAYDQAQPPLSVRSLLAILRSWEGDFLAAPVFAADSRIPVSRYTLRLGNRMYPHMKLAIQRSADEGMFLFSADTHDRHVCPPTNAPDYREFQQLIARNQKLAEAIEAAWAADGLPTLKTYLRNNLVRRNTVAK